MKQNFSNVSVLIANGDEKAETLIDYMGMSNFNILISGEREETVNLLNKGIISVLLFWDRPDEDDSLLFLRRIHNRFNIPVILLSDNPGLSYILGAYKAGIDDFIRLPQAPWFITVKTRAVLRRCGDSVQVIDEHIRIETEHSSLRMSPVTRQLFSGDSEIRLTCQEWELFNYLVKRQNRIIPRNRLMASRFPGMEPESRILDNHIKNIRSKLPDPGSIQTVRGIGYYFCGETYEDEQAAADLLCG